MSTHDILKRRQKRSLATILAYKEQHIDPSLTPEQRAGLRKVILDEFNGYMNLVLDMKQDATPALRFDMQKLAAQVNDLHEAICPEIPVDVRELADLEPDP